MHTEFKYSVIVQEKSYSEKVDSLSKEYKRMYDVQENLEWTLGKNPLLGVACEHDKSHRVIKTAAIGHTPSFWILYRFDPSESKVYLLSLTPVSSEENP